MNQYKITRWAVRVILIALIVCHMSIIFGFSSDTGEQSQSLSDKITIQVIRIVNSDYDTLSESEQTEYFHTVSFIVRKVGHFGEYAILGMLVIGLLLTFERLTEQKHKAVIAVAISVIVCFVYAITDELHQGFVAGRSPKVFDVGIDTLGGLIGAIIVMGIFLFARRYKNNRAHNQCVED